MKYKNILAVTDFSSCADNAVKLGVEFVNFFGAKLTVLHVAHDESHFELFINEDRYEEIRNAIDKEAEKNFAEMEKRISELNGIDWTSKVRRGVPYIEIVYEIEDSGYDLLIIGSHGHTGLKKFLYGSTAEKVVSNSPISVHITKDGKECG